MGSEELKQQSRSGSTRTHDEDWPVDVHPASHARVYGSAGSGRSAPVRMPPRGGGVQGIGVSRSDEILRRPPETTFRFRYPHLDEATGLSIGPIHRQGCFPAEPASAPPGKVIVTPAVKPPAGEAAGARFARPSAGGRSVPVAAERKPFASAPVTLFRASTESMTHDRSSQRKRALSLNPWAVGWDREGRRES